METRVQITETDMKQERVVPLVILSNLLGGLKQIDPRIEQFLLKGQVEKEIQQYLLSSETGEISAEDRLVIGVSTLLKEYVPKSQHGRGTYQPIEFGEKARFTPDDVDFMAEVGIARAVVNSYKVLIQKDKAGKPSKYGEKAVVANENPNNLHHGAPHDRRIEREMDSQYVNIATLRNVNVKPWVISSYLAASQHDGTQKIWTYLNQQEGRKGDNAYDEKQGHALEQSFIPYLNRKRIATLLGVSEAEATRITAGMWFMSVLHDEPDIYEKAIRCTDPVKEGETIDSLYARFRKGEVDLATITKQQYVFMAIKEKMRKQKSGAPSPFITEENVFGFIPDLVAEYEEEILELLDDTSPLLPPMTDEQREGLVQASLAYEWADTVEFNSPYNESLGRKLETRYSKERPLFVQDREKMMSYANTLRLEKGLPSFDDQTDIVDVLLHVAKEGTGNFRGELKDLDTDVGRLVWEFFHLNDWGSEFRRMYNKDTAIMGVIATRNIIGDFMNANIDRYDAVVLSNCVHLGEKLLRRYGITQEGYKYLTRLHHTPEAFLNVVEAYLLKKDPSLGTRFTQIKAHVLHQHHDVLTNLDVAEKPSNKNNTRVSLTVKSFRKSAPPQVVTIERYSEEQQNDFRRFMSRVLEELVIKYEVTPQELAQYEQLVSESKPSPLQPYDTYLNTSRVDAMTLLRPPDTASWQTIQTIAQA